MTDFTADPDALDNQGYLHSQIVLLYRDIASEIRSHGGPIVSAFQKVQSASYAANYASDYQQWLNPDRSSAGICNLDANPGVARRTGKRGQGSQIWRQLI